MIKPILIILFLTLSGCASVSQYRCDKQGILHQTYITEERNGTWYCYPLGGINLAMSSDYQLPDFTSKEQAESWARRTKYVPAVYEMLLERYVSLVNTHMLILLSQHYVLTLLNSSLAEYDWDALTIMEGFRRLGPRGRGDNAMGSYFVVSERPMI